MVNLPTAGVDFHVPLSAAARARPLTTREQAKNAAAEFYTTVKNGLHVWLLRVRKCGHLPSFMARTDGAHIVILGARQGIRAAAFLQPPAEASAEPQKHSMGRRTPPCSLASRD